MAPKFTEHAFSGSFVHYAAAFPLSASIARTVLRDLWLVAYGNRIVPDDVDLDSSTFYRGNTFEP